MDENEFRRILELFPVVRSRDYQYDVDDASRQSSRSAPREEVKDWQDAWDSDDKSGETVFRTKTQEAFWSKLMSVVEPKMDVAEAESFCKAFLQVYNEYVYENLTLDAARGILNSKKT